MKDLNEHVGELISGYIDGELTQQVSQRVELHTQTCSECRSALEDLRGLQQRVGAAQLESMDQTFWREKVNDVPAQTALSLGWFFLIGGLLLATGYGVVQFITDPDIASIEKVAGAAIYLGLAGLFFAVLRQRLHERKTDKYNDVEI